MGEISQFVKVNGYRVKALIDTGATTNFLSSRIAKRTKLLLEKPYTFSVGDGKRHNGRISYATIEAYNRSGSAKVVVTNILPDTDNYDVILGQSFLQDNEVNLDFKHDKMTYGDHQPKMRRIGRL